MGIYKVHRPRGVRGITRLKISVVKFVFCPGSPEFTSRSISQATTSGGIYEINIFIGRSTKLVSSGVRLFSLGTIRLRKGRDHRLYRLLRGRGNLLGIVGTVDISATKSVRGCGRCMNTISCFLFSAGYGAINKDNRRFS